jgi:DNA-binding NarL/FixJ family response regulator
MNNIRVVLVEDHDVVRIGLRTTLEREDGIQVVGEAASGTQGLKLLETTPADIAVVDIGLPGMDGIELTRQFRKFQADHEMVTTKVLILTMQGNEDSVLASFAAGADSYCMKDTGMERVVEAIKMTHSGNPWIDPAIASIVLRQMRQVSPQSGDASDQMVHKQQLTIRNRRQMLKPLGLIVPQILLIALPTHPIGRIGNHHIKLIVIKFVIRQRIAMLNLRIHPKPTFNLCQRIQRIIPVLAKGLS